MEGSGGLVHGVRGVHLGPHLCQDGSFLCRLHGFRVAHFGGECRERRQGSLEGRKVDGSSGGVLWSRG